VLRELEASVTPLAPPPPRRVRNRWLVLSAVIVVAAMATGIATQLIDRGDKRTPSDRSAKAVANGCAPPAEVFGQAWSADRRRAVMARHKTEAMLVAVTGMIEEIRSEWYKAYNTACAMPESQGRHERLACLISVRGELDEATKEMAEPGSSISVTELIPLTMEVNHCKDED
jgi:hypothetical protein